MTPDFERAFEKTVGLEGGYSDNPNDPGGRTMYGISERSHPELWRDGRPTLERAQECYFNEYWLPARCDLIESGRMQHELFDSAVNCGQRSAVKFAQRAYNVLTVGLNRSPLAVDGWIGPKTIRAINDFTSHSEDWDFALWKWSNHFQGAYYLEIDNPHFLRGWAKRL